MRPLPLPVACSSAAASWMELQPVQGRRQVAHLHRSAVWAACPWPAVALSSTAAWVRRRCPWPEPWGQAPCCLLQGSLPCWACSGGGL